MLFARAQEPREQSNLPIIKSLSQPSYLKRNGPTMRYDSDRTLAETCSRIKDLGYGIAEKITLYGQRFQIVSDPFPDGQGISVQAVTANDPTRRPLRLPVSLLIGLKDLFPG